MGAHSISAPYATLDATPESISVTFRDGFFSFPQSVIEKIGPFPGIHMQGLEIIHSDSDLPRPVIFWTFTPEETRRELRTLGYKVVDPD